MPEKQITYYSLGYNSFLERVSAPVIEGDEFHSLEYEASLQEMGADFAARIPDIAQAFDLRHASDPTKIDGGDIYANSVTATQIAANTITANEIAAGTITATEITVSQLSAIAADLGTITAGTITGGTIKTAGSGARVEMFPDANTGLIAYDDAGAEIFKILVGGTDVGDVIIGDFANNKGVKWDKSASTFSIRGALNADDISAGTLTGRTVQTGSSGQRVVLNSTNNQIELYDSGGTKIVTLDAVDGNFNILSNTAASHVVLDDNYSYLRPESDGGCELE